MQPLRYSINITLDGCCDHRAVVPDEALHRHHAQNLAQADALLFGRVTYEMMEPFARTIDAAKKYVVSSTLKRVDLKPVGRLELNSGAVAMRYEPRR